MDDDTLDRLLALASVEAHLGHLTNDADEADDFYKKFAYEYARHMVSDQIARMRQKMISASAPVPPSVTTVECTFCKWCNPLSNEAGTSCVLLCEQCGNEWIYTRPVPA